MKSIRRAKSVRPISRAGTRRRALLVEALEDRVVPSQAPHLLLDVNTTRSSDPSGPVVIGATSYFSADDGIHGRELWKSDGTAAGTVLVKDVNPGGTGSNPSDLTNVNGTLFFTADDGTDGRELWKSDGTAGGTVLVKDINPGSIGSHPVSLTNVNGTLYFAANDGGSGGVELWQSDGTVAGTVQVADINPGGTGSYPANLTNSNGILFFRADDGVHGPEPWVLPAAASTPTAANLAVSGFPTTTTAGVPGSFTVTAKNTDGTTAADYTGTIRFTSSDGQAVLPAFYTFTVADSGLHTFSATLKTAGTQSLTATDTLTLSVTGSETGITVSPAMASRLGVTAPAGSTAGSAFSVTLTARDAYNNTATSYAGTVHFTNSDRAATLPGNYTFKAADQGVHTFAGLVLRKKGRQNITVTDTLNGSIAGSTIENVF